MADETLLLDPQAQQEKQRKEGVKGEAKPTQKKEAQDAATPPPKKQEARRRLRAFCSGFRSLG